MKTAALRIMFVAGVAVFAAEAFAQIPITASVPSAPSAAPVPLAGAGLLSFVFAGCVAGIGAVVRRRKRSKAN